MVISLLTMFSKLSVILKCAVHGAQFTVKNEAGNLNTGEYVYYHYAKPSLR